MTVNEFYLVWLRWAEENRAANTVASQGSAIKSWLKTLPKALKVDAITSNHVSKFINRDDGVSLSQRRFRLSAINSYTILAKERGFAKGNPASRLRVDMKKLTHRQKEKKVKHPITKDEYDNIIEHAWRKGGRHSRFFKAATAISYWTGLRMSDCATLEWDALTSEPDHIVVWTAKAGDKQHARVALPLSDPLIGGGDLTDILNELTDGWNDMTYVFPVERNLMTTVSKRSHLPQYYIRMLKGLSIHGKSFHCLRHSFVTRLSEAGKKLEDIGKLVAHKDTATTEEYIAV